MSKSRRVVRVGDTEAYKAAFRRAPRRRRAQTELVEFEPLPRRRVYRRAARKVAAKEKDPGAISKAGNYIGGAIGSSFGPIGTGIGSFLGGKLGHLIETVTGFGDYRIESNSIMKGGMTVPQIVNSVNGGGVIIRHREFIKDIVATQAFSVESFLIQPGLANTFPWLSQIANGFEQYRLRGMIFEYNTTSSDALLSTATSTALGTVIMQTEYDVADAIATSKRQMLNSEFASSSKPSCTFIHPIECKKSLSAQNILYTRGAIAPPPNFDQRLYDFARFQIATEGMQADGGTLGELWVTYEIELLKPQFSFFGLTDHFRLNTITTLRPFGTATGGSSIAAGGTMGGSMNGNGLSYDFPAAITSGQYLFTYTVVGGAVASATLPVITITGGLLQGYWVNNSLGYVDCPEPPGITPGASVIASGTLIVTSSVCKINLAAVGGVFPTANAGDLWVTRIADSITF